PGAGVGERGRRDRFPRCRGKVFEAAAYRGKGLDAPAQLVVFGHQLLGPALLGGLHFPEEVVADLKGLAHQTLISSASISSRSLSSALTILILTVPSAIPVRSEISV